MDMSLEKQVNFCRMPEWYPRLAVHSFPTVFVMLQPNEIEALKEGRTEGEAVAAVIPRLRTAMATFLYTRFVSVDLVAPTDTERFDSKRGAVRSAESAWKILAESKKVRDSAAAGNVSCICVRPFRRMDVTREFRLFVKEGELKSMSQYWLIRHFNRLQKRKEKYWALAEKFIQDNAWALPLKDLVVDIYFTSSDEIIVLDLNTWGMPTDPLMLNKWTQNWDVVKGCKIVPPPHRLSGDVNVSF